MRLRRSGSGARAYFAVALLLTVLVGGGCIVGIQLLARNERASQTLREQASLLDKAQDAILVTDLQRRLTYWNKSAERLYGWTAEEVMGKVVTESVLSRRRRPGGAARPTRTSSRAASGPASCSRRPRPAARS